MGPGSGRRAAGRPARRSGRAGVLMAATSGGRRAARREGRAGFPSGADRVAAEGLVPGGGHRVGRLGHDRAAAGLRAEVGPVAVEARRAPASSRRRRRGRGSSAGRSRTDAHPRRRSHVAGRVQDVGGAAARGPSCGISGSGVVVARAAGAASRSSLQARRARALRSSSSAARARGGRLDRGGQLAHAGLELDGQARRGGSASLRWRAKAAPPRTSAPARGWSRAGCLTPPPGRPVVVLKLRDQALELGLDGA